MSKNFFSKTFKFLAVAGAFFAIASYIKQYKKFNKELDDDFYKFEDEDEAAEAGNDNFSDRKYTALAADKNDFVLAAKDTANAAVSMAVAGKQLIKDVGNIIADNVSSAESLGSFSAKNASKLAKDGLNKASNFINNTIKSVAKPHDTAEDDSEIDVEIYDLSQKNADSDNEPTSVKDASSDIKVAAKTELKNTGTVKDKVSKSDNAAVSTQIYEEE